MNAIKEHLEDMGYTKSIKRDSANPGVTILELT
jgi:hypothetical protein